MGLGGSPPTHPNQTPNTKRLCRGSQSVGDNFHGRKGNSPDRQLRSQIESKFLRKSNCKDSQDVGLEAATI
jgi:hypothetical protein